MNMAYRPRSRPAFAGDLRHDIRDAMYDGRAETLSIWVGLAADRYMAACHVPGVRDDPVADSLETFDSFDLATLRVAHDHMAAYWRCHGLEVFLNAPQPVSEGLVQFAGLGGPGRWAMRWSMSSILAAFRWWLKEVTEAAAVKDPVLVRQLCLVLVQQNTAAGYGAEIDLFDALRARYRVPTIPPS